MELTSTADERQRDSKQVHRVQLNVEDQHGQYDRQDLLDVGWSEARLSITERHQSRVLRYSPATVIVNADVFLLAVKLTTFRPNAIAPFIASAIALCRVISVALYSRTRSSSPDVHPKNTHWQNARGDMRMSKSKGCNLSRPTCTPADVRQISHMDDQTRPDQSHGL